MELIVEVPVGCGDQRASFPTATPTRVRGVRVEVIEPHVNGVEPYQIDRTPEARLELRINNRFAFGLRLESVLPSVWNPDGYASIPVRIGTDDLAAVRVVSASDGDKGKVRVTFKYDPI